MKLKEWTLFLFGNEYQTVCCRNNYFWRFNWYCGQKVRIVKLCGPLVIGHAYKKSVLAKICGKRWSPQCKVILSWCSYLDKIHHLRAEWKPKQTEWPKISPRLKSTFANSNQKHSSRIKLSRTFQIKVLSEKCLPFLKTLKNFHFNATWWSLKKYSISLKLQPKSKPNANKKSDLEKCLNISE